MMIFLEPTTLIFAAVSAVLLFTVVSAWAKSEALFYSYLASLFYADYLKLMMPSLPVGFIPDILLFMFLLRVVIFEAGRLQALLLNKRLFFSNCLIFGYFLFSFLEIFNPLLPSTALGLQAFRPIFKIMVIYWGALLVADTSENAFYLIRFIVVNILIVFLFSFKQIIFGFSGYELVVYSPGTIRRIYSTLTNAAVFSLVLGVGAIYHYLEALYKGKFSSMLLCFAFLLVSLTSLHRAPLFATVIAIFLVTAVNLRIFTAFMIRRMSLWLGMIFIIILSLVYIFYGPMPSRLVLTRDQAVSRIYDTKEGGHEKSLNVRIKQMESILTKIAKYPLGVGLGYTQLRFGNRFENASMLKGLSSMSYSSVLPMGTGDNTFFTVIAEAGWVGAIYFVALLVIFWIAALFRVIACPAEGDSKYLFSFALGVMTIVILSIATSSIYFTVIVGSVFWISVAISQSTRLRGAND